MKRVLFVMGLLLLTISAFSSMVAAQESSYFYDPAVDAETHLATLVPACFYVQPDVFPNNVLDVAEAQGFTTFAAAVRAAGAEDLLTTKNGFTIFAPTNAAFDALPAGALDELLANPGKLRQVILFHIIQDPYLASELPTGSVRTSLGKNVTITAAPTVNDANVVIRDIDDASNGIIHGINQVLLPPDGTFTTRNRPPAEPQPYSAECNCYIQTIVAEQRALDPDFVPYEDRVADLATATSFDEYTVQPGDTLAQISFDFYGTGNMWEAIYAANANILSDPRVIIPGQVIEIPLE